MVLYVIAPHLTKDWSKLRCHILLNIYSLFIDGRHKGYIFTQITKKGLKCPSSSSYGVRGGPLLVYKMYKDFLFLV